MKPLIRHISRHIFRCIALIICLVTLAGCSGDSPATPDDDKAWITKRVAVVLPMEKGLDSHWKRTLGMFGTNFSRAFRNHDTGVRLEFEYYDEATTDVKELASRLAFDEDVYAVIGGLYSSDAALLASELTRTGKTYFTLATTEQLVRGFASTGYLWAMTETDITQCEVLLSKVINYGGKSVALIAKENDSYGQTFIDWFAFQAKELGLENKGVYCYDDTSVAEMSRQAQQSGADYVICVPSEIGHMEHMMRGYSLRPRARGKTPRLLFSDTAYGVDVLATYGREAEGIEGVCFGADPESGFDVSYRIFFGTDPTVGEAQLYDAAMLIGYAAWYQHLHPDVSLQKSLRAIVSGTDLNMGSWTGEDMGLVADALAAGKSPHVRGASGHLRFDSKVFTNVLATTYYNYKVYDGQYIILDYNTSDGGNRTDATLAGWNWKASQMQEFGESQGQAYPPHLGNKALLVATSRGWANYRHQADVLAIYRQLKASGYTDSDIILIAEDDIAHNPANPDPGEIRVTPGGANVYDDVEIDYRLTDLAPGDVLRILAGEASPRLPEVIRTGAGDNLFIYWSGHGVPGALCWDEESYGVTGDSLAATLADMHSRGRYRKLLMMVEACYSGSVMEQCAGIPGALFITAAAPDETSKADVFSNRLKVWMSNRFTSTFIDVTGADNTVSLRDLYYRLFINTVGSHVMVYNADLYGNLYTSGMAEFITCKPVARFL